MTALITLALSNFTLTFFVLGVIAALVAVALKPDGFTRANVAEQLLAYFILFTDAPGGKTGVDIIADNGK